MAADPVVKYMSKEEIKKQIIRVRNSMLRAAKELDFLEAHHLMRHMDFPMMMRRLLLRGLEDLHLAVHRRLVRAGHDATRADGDRDQEERNGLIYS